MFFSEIQSTFYGLSGLGDLICTCYSKHSRNRRLGYYLGRGYELEFVNLFSKLLENSYASKLESYSDEVISFRDEIVRGKYALVKTEIIRKDGTIDVNYKLIRENGIWKVFDFLIEGVSMINNYRSQFNRIIKAESYIALKKKMIGKIQGIEYKGL